MKVKEIISYFYFFLIEDFHMLLQFAEAQVNLSKTSYNNNNKEV
jgi:hypothetical protein